MSITGHTIGEAMAYFRWKSIRGCLLRRCWSCDAEWDALRGLQRLRTDEKITGEKR